MGSPPDVLIYDTTLRDGTQGEGFQLSVSEKLEAALLLDDLGVAYIEGGWPQSNPRDGAFFEQAGELSLRRARLAAFGATRRARSRCESDANVQALVRAGTPVVTVFGKSWKFHAEKALRIDPAANLELIEDTVRYLKARVDEVIFDAEHFFDGYADDPEYALAALDAACSGGADWVVLCDTNGGTLTPDVSAIVSLVAQCLECPVGIHTHNDAELAVANSLAAVRSGATMVQGTINGVGERCGNANLVSIVGALELKMGLRCLPAGSHTKLTRVSRSIDELTNRIPWSQQPWVGASAFAHKGGVHVNAVLKDSRTYEHVAPESVGNRRRFLVSDLSGRANVVAKMREYGVEVDPGDDSTAAIVERVKALENEGYSYEGAGASFRLLVEEALGRRRRFFTLKDLFVEVDIAERDERLGQSPGRSLARVRLEVDGVLADGQAVGNGPVHALDGAFREAVHRFYPVLESVRLVDYKVRILSSSSGTDSGVRVLIKSADGEELWGTVGVSTNIIQASWRALTEALEYKLLKEEAHERIESRPHL